MQRLVWLCVAKCNGDVRETPVKYDVFNAGTAVALWRGVESRFCNEP
jgi:hypothetical protein